MKRMAQFLVVLLLGLSSTGFAKPLSVEIEYEWNVHVWVYYSIPRYSIPQGSYATLVVDFPSGRQTIIDTAIIDVQACCNRPWYSSNHYFGNVSMTGQLPQDFPYTLQVINPSNQTVVTQSGVVTVTDNLAFSPRIFVN